MASATLDSPSSKTGVAAAARDMSAFTESRDTNVAWKKSEAYVKATLFTNNYQNLSPEARTDFLKRAEAWPDGARNTFLLSVPQVIEFKRLFDDRVYNSISEMGSWSAECEFIMLAAISRTHRADLLTKPDLLEEITKLEFSSQKLYLSTLTKYPDFIDLLADPAMLKKLNGLSKVQSFVYLKEIATGAKFVAFDDWKQNLTPKPAQA